MPRFPTARVLLLLVFFFTSQAFAATKQITVLHTGDLHARLLPTPTGVGGFAQLATVLAEQKRATPGAIVLDGGDMVQGSPVSTLFSGTPVYEVASLLGIDASVLGNHEFDYGSRQIEAFKEKATFPLLSANILRDGKTIADAPSKVFTIEGVRVGVIGLTTTTLTRLTFPEHIEGLTIQPIKKSVRDELALLKPSVDIFVVLGHLTRSEADSVLRDFPEVAAVISGHPHSHQEPRRIGKGLVVSLVSYGAQVGKLTLDWSTEARTVRTSRWERIEVRGATPNPAVSEAVAVWEGKVSAVVDKPIGSSARVFTKPEVKELTERALRETLKVDFAFQNIGGVRDGLPAGALLARHVWNTHPFNNRVVIGRFKGHQIPRAVRGSATIEPEREYSLACSDFVAVNQGEMGTQGLQFPNSRGAQIRDLMIEWIKGQQTVR